MMDKEGLLIAAILAIGVAVLVPTLEGPKDRAVSVASADLPPILPTLRPQISAQSTPVQAEITPFTVDLGFGFQGIATHRYTIAGQVLLRRPYTWDATAEISPLDLAIGWGVMATPETRDNFALTGGKRIVHIRGTDPTKDPWPIMSLWSNTHIIPASDAVRDAAQALQPGQRVRLHGYLMKVSGARGLIWEGSTSRDDRGFSACEIMLVERIEIIDEAST